MCAMKWTLRGNSMWNECKLYWLLLQVILSERWPFGWWTLCKWELYNSTSFRYSRKFDSTLPYFIHYMTRCQIRQQCFCTRIECTECTITVRHWWTHSRVNESKTITSASTWIYIYIYSILSMYRITHSCPNSHHRSYELYHAIFYT